MASISLWFHLGPRTLGALNFLRSWFNGPLRRSRCSPGSSIQLLESRILTRPPRVSLGSTSRTVEPSDASWTAAARPATPPPTTMPRICESQRGWSNVVSDHSRRGGAT